MTLHYTPNLRTEDASVMMIGQGYIEIPPGHESVEVTGECTKEDTRLILKAPIYITQALNHMHYMGTMVFIRSFTYSHTWVFPGTYSHGWVKPSVRVVLNVAFIPGCVMLMD